MLFFYTTTFILQPFYYTAFKETVKVDIGKLAMWRIKTHEQFGGTWLSDYVPNKLGGFDKAETCDESMDEGMQGIT